MIGCPNVVIGSCGKHLLNRLAIAAGCQEENRQTLPPRIGTHCLAQVNPAQLGHFHI
jgi:hypothetical protein